MNKSWFSLLLLMGCTACIVLPTAPTVLEGRRSDHMDLSFLSKGQTQKELVFEKLGLPTAWLPSQRTAVYGAKFSTKTLYWGGGSPMGGGGFGSAPMAQREALFLTFDESERVLDWGVGKVPLTETWLSAALVWGKSRGLQLFEPSKQFHEMEVSSQRCQVYVFCPQHPSLLSADLFPSVTLDGLMLGQVRKGSFLRIEMGQGTHLLSIYPDTKIGTPRSGPYSVTTPSIDLLLQPGETKFFELRVERGLNSVTAVLSERSRLDASAVLNTLRETW